ncbi:MAG: stage 0 sporulation family protein [Clostridiales bacterium]|jgi:cell fate regulator YaaT (PSP1 superfamily)|nr:stage 0 sporulation family protein [Clostridiales bacterium]
MEIIGVRFRTAGKIYSFDPDGVKFREGDRVLVETARGLEIGEVARENCEIGSGQTAAPLKKIIRPATEDDSAHWEENARREGEALEVCSKKILAHGLPMKLIDVEITFDRNKIIFYFTADGRVDFRELVKDLASVFRTRIELRQVGVRDEAKILNGIGICGRTLCCATFLEQFAPVSIKMAKDQGLSLNPTKISGSCGRLMCCLKYEQDVYETLTKNLPDVGDVVMTPDGRGEVVSVYTLRQLVRVAVGEDGETEVGVYAVSEIKPIHRTGRRREQSEDDEEIKKLLD